MYTITPATCRAARGLLRWSQAELATRAHVGVVTVRQFENGHATPRTLTIRALEGALEEAGVEFTNGDKPGVRLARETKH